MSFDRTRVAIHKQDSLTWTKEEIKVSIQKAERDLNRLFMIHESLSNKEVVNKFWEYLEDVQLKHQFKDILKQKADFNTVSQSWISNKYFNY